MDNQNHNDVYNDYNNSNSINNNNDKRYSDYCLLNICSLIKYKYIYIYDIYDFHGKCINICMSILQKN